MEPAAFWAIVEAARAEAGPDTERVAQALLRRLRGLRPEEIEPFQDRWDEAQDELYRWPVLDAATLLLGPIDDFAAVQDWILSHGRRTVQRVLADPDTLVELVPDRHNATIDWFCGLALDAHITMTGFSLPAHVPSGPDTPAGTPADLTDEIRTRRRYPRLTAYLDAHPWIERPWETASR